MNQVAKLEEPALPAKTGAIKSGGGVLAVVPQSLDDVYRLANLIHKSGIGPKDFKSPEACTVAILHGMEIGLKPMQALQRIAVINGRPTLWGDAMLGLVQASGLLEDIQESFEGKPGSDEHKAICVVKRIGRPTPIVGTFSQLDAKKAGLFGKAGPHTQYPDRMKQMRARSFALRDGFPDVLGGMYSAEEVLDMGEMKDVTPQARPRREDFERSSKTEPVAHNADGEIIEETQSPAPSETKGAVQGDLEPAGDVVSSPAPAGDSSEYDDWFTQGIVDHDDGKGLMTDPDGATPAQIKARRDGWNSAASKVKR